ncbi:MAG TPA: TonB-dependent receptor, partial [Bryobacteraceae bacterium]|nr:TonB-dependent receptor [Bryobacteraceae bacterium]
MRLYNGTQVVSVTGRFRLVIAIALVGLPVQAEITLAGRVIDETGEGVGDARITLHADTFSTSATSDPTGAFSATLPGPGHYLAYVERDGFFPLKDSPVDVAEDTREIHLSLNHVREEFTRVKVSASTSAVDVDDTAAGQKLTGIEIMDMPYTPTRDLRAALPLLPGVIEDPSGGLHFDGGLESQTLYLLDGFDISDPLTGKLDTTISVESVRTVDWISGRYSAEFGKGSGGALQLHTDMGDDPWRYSATNFLPGFDTRLGLHVGTFAPRANLSGPIKRGRAWFSEHADLDYSRPVVPGLPANQNTSQIVLGSNILRAQADLTPSNILFADFLVNYELAPQYGLDVLDPVSTTIDQHSHTYFFSVKDQIYVTRGTLLEIGFAGDANFLRRIPQGDAFYDITPAGRSGNYYIDSTQKSGRSQALANVFLPSFEAWGHHQFKTGVDVDHLNYNQDFVRTGIDAFDSAGDLLRQTTFMGSGVVSQGNYEASWYLVDEWKVRPDVVVETGVREDWDDLLRRWAPSPRVATSWAPLGSKDTKISAGYAIMRDATPLILFTRPRDQYSIDTYYNPDGTIAEGPITTMFEITNRNLKFPEYRTWTLGLEQHLPKKILLGVNGISKHGGDGLSYTPSTLVPVDSMMIYQLGNLRHDSYDAATVSVRQRFGEQ